MEAGASASTSGRMGVPTKVMLHKKNNKQYTNLAVIQELYAHTGEATPDVDADALVPTLEIG